MKNKINITFALIAILITTLTACSNSKIKYTVGEGKFEKSSKDIIETEYNNKSDHGFFALIDFDLTEGKVDWEIVQPNGEITHKGYVVYENGKIYRELTYPKITDSITNWGKVEIDKDEIEFKGLLFVENKSKGSYKLILKPLNAEEKYIIKWSNRLPDV